MSMENDQYHIVSYKLGGAGRKTHTHTHHESPVPCVLECDS